MGNNDKRVPHQNFGLWRGLLEVVVLLAILLAVGCAGATSSGVDTHRTSSQVSTPTITPSLSGITPDAAVASLCSTSPGSPLAISQVQVGTFDTWQELPSDLPLKPESISVAKVSGNVALNSVTIDIGLRANQAPSPGASGTICAVTARITAYQPLPAPIPNITRVCADHPYTDPGGADYGGDCSVFAGPPAGADITFTSSLPGTTISTPIESEETPGKPAVFPPPDGRTSSIWIYLKVPASGKYTITIGVWQDRSGPTLLTTTSEDFDLTALHEWSGQACTLLSMQAELPPPTNPPSQLLCPGVAPALG